VQVTKGGETYGFDELWNSEILDIINRKKGDLFFGAPTLRGGTP
jgi:hypothetical protein